MFRKIAFAALALTSGLVSAAQIPATLNFTTNNDVAYSYALPQTETGSVVFGYDFSFTGKVEGNDFLGMWFSDGSKLSEAYKGPNFGFKANCGSTSLTPTCKNDLFVRTEGTNGYFIADSDLKENTTYRLFGHIYKSGASTYYDRFDMWLNPTSAEMRSLTGADASATGKSNIQSISTVGFRTANLNSGLTMNVNGLQVNEVPEPGSVALMGLALACLAFTRRNRR